MPMVKTPIKQKIKIPQYSKASMNVTAIMVFLLPDNMYNPYSPEVMS
jgi:hypothetical protein